MGITKLEIGALTNFLNSGGYVLDFSTADFDAFTFDSVGVPLCATYKLSKGKSLIAFLQEHNEAENYKLLSDLLTHYEYSGEIEHDKEHDQKRYASYLKCRAIIDKYKALSPLETVGDKLKEEFDSQYLSSQIDLMFGMIEQNPTEAIGKSKELLESCCKTILEKSNVQVEKDWDCPRLVDEVFKFFHIMPKDIADDVKGSKSIKQVLGSLKAVVQGVTELRNLYGTGHGKSHTFVGLEPRHAYLAVGASTTLAKFMWDSYERNLKKKEI